MCFPFFHSYSKWKEHIILFKERRISENYALKGFKEIWARRVCGKCGKSQTKLVKTIIMD